MNTAETDIFFLNPNTLRYLITLDKGEKERCYIDNKHWLGTPCGYYVFSLDYLVNKAF
jgi:hypothetical protein